METYILFPSARGSTFALSAEPREPALHLAMLSFRQLVDLLCVLCEFKCKQVGEAGFEPT